MNDLEDKVFYPGDYEKFSNLLSKVEIVNNNFFKFFHYIVSKGKKD